MKRTICTKQDLVDLNIEVKTTEEGKHEVYRNGTKMKRYLLNTYHKYGKTISYYGYSIYYGRIETPDGFRYRQNNILEHVIMWLWFKGDIPEGYDVDHINNKTLDNNLENLQLLTRAENLRKRGIGRNKYSYNLTDEEILELREFKKWQKLQKNKQKKQPKL